jgi:hypothetical protein
MNRLSTFTSFLYANNIGSVYRTKDTNYYYSDVLVSSYIYGPVWFVSQSHPTNQKYWSCQISSYLFGLLPIMWLSIEVPLIDPSVIPARILQHMGGRMLSQKVG